MWNRRQRRFQNQVTLHVIHALPYDGIFSSANGTQVYCHPSKETEGKLVIEALFQELGHTLRTYPSMLKRIKEKYPRAC